MRFLEALASAFFRTFGITQPSDQTRRRAAWFLLATLCVVFIGICAVASLLIHIV